MTEKPKDRYFFFLFLFSVVGIPLLIILGLSLPCLLQMASIAV
ncbi:hypothetical protein [uncultured Alcanivorax sp.]|nr:hypothetical protein [uncultured Alcanivorax sp.]